VNRAERIYGRSPCYGCGLKAAGNALAGPYSAFCESCQPRDELPVQGAANVCAACGEQLGRLKDFDAHQGHYPQGHPEWGCFTGVCKDPATLPGDPLIRDDRGVWLTSAGLVKRRQSGDALRARGQQPR
jgi:hypothetical protein